MLNTVKRNKRREEFLYFKRLKEESADISNLKQQIIIMKRELKKQDEKIREDQKKWKYPYQSLWQGSYRWEWKYSVITIENNES